MKTVVKLRAPDLLAISRLLCVSAGFAGIVVTGLSAPATATSNYAYKEGEYVTIRAGEAPDKTISIAAHGKGEYGDDNFQLYLMAEPAHKVISVIASVGGEAFLDTDAKEYEAAWSADSAHVAITYRQDRRQRETRLFAIRNGRARPVKGPDLLAVALGKYVYSLGARKEIHASFSELKWLTPTRFMLTERRIFHTRSPARTKELSRILGKYGKTKEINDEQSFVEFSAEAACKLILMKKYRIQSIRPR